jgi:hypothetical protein
MLNVRWQKREFAVTCARWERGYNRNEICSIGPWPSAEINRALGLDSIGAPLRLGYASG